MKKVKQYYYLLSAHLVRFSIFSIIFYFVCVIIFHKLFTHEMDEGILQHLLSKDSLGDWGLFLIASLIFSAFTFIFYQINKMLREQHAELVAKTDELEEARSQLEKANEYLEGDMEKLKFFAYSVAHDLKSPAVGIYGLAKLLKKQCSDIIDDKVRKYCEQIQMVARQIHALTDQINQYIDTKEAPAIVEDVDLNGIMECLRDEFSTQVGIRNIRLNFPPVLSKIKADPMSILRALRNLVDNAIKYGGEELSEITIGYEALDGFHVFSVSDNGIGINSDTDKIFNVFQRSETAKGTQGAGLGLAIVKTIAENHGGRVWAELNDKERETTFFFTVSDQLKCLET